MEYCSALRSVVRIGLGVLFIGLWGVTPAQAQNCTGPDGVLGDIAFNSSFDVFQGCTPQGWVAFHKPAVIPDCTTSSVIGTACADGQTVYAGTSGANRLYTTKVDQAASAYWGAEGHALGGNAHSETDGLVNTNTALAAIEGAPQAGACNAVPYNPPACAPNAHILCKNLRTTLGGDWYLPADQELTVMLNNGAAIGGFVGSGRYWSSTANGSFGASNLQYPGASGGINNRRFLQGVRCVRR